MYYAEIKDKLSSLVEETSWEQVLFAMSQLAIDSEDSEDSDLTNNFGKLADQLHDLSNLMG